MKRYFSACITALSILLVAACGKEPPVSPDTGEYPYSLSVWNEDYTEELALSKMGLVELSSVESTPSWIGGVTLSQDPEKEITFARIEVKRTLDLPSEQKADIKLKMNSGATATLHLVQWPAGPAANAPVESMNKEFEKDWSSAKTISLVLKTTDLNGRAQVVTEPVQLPWAANNTHHLPYGEITKMLDHKDDWRMVFNLTGVEVLPKRHYFALYNRYTGVLRVFYYWDSEDIPTDGNDHLWSFELDRSVSEHQATQFAVPYEETATDAYKRYAADPVLLTPYASRADEAQGGKLLPAVGWWAFDVNMAASRKHDFFSEAPKEYTAKIAPNIYHEDNVALNSILKGTLDGALKGKVNLDAMYPKGTTGWGNVLNVAGSTLGGGMTSNFVLQSAFGKAGDGTPGKKVGGSIMAFVGAAFSAGGKLAEKELKKTDVPSELGEINASINLDLNATMTTTGITGGARATTIPPTTLEMGNFWQETRSDEPTGFGKGVWNLRKHPVVYVVTDAYWCETNFSVKSSEVLFRKDKKDYYCYKTASDPDRPGLRIVSFLDPTSVEGIYLNDDLFDAGINSCEVELTYGIYPSSEEGYTNAFRSSLGLNTDLSWRFSQKKSFVSSDPSQIDFKLCEKKRTDAIFGSTEIEPELTDYVAYRRSEKIICDTLIRRYYGPSMFYTKEFANPYQVDVVHYVSEPQIDVPFDNVAKDAKHKPEKMIIDPQLPDLVVTAVLKVEGMDHTDDEEQTMVNTLRFVPEIKYIKLSQLNSICNSIASHQMTNITGRSMDVSWTFKDEQIKKIQNFRDAFSK